MADITLQKWTSSYFVGSISLVAGGRRASTVPAFSYTYKIDIHCDIFLIFFLAGFRSTVV